MKININNSSYHKYKYIILNNLFKANSKIAKTSKKLSNRYLKGEVQ